MENGKNDVQGFQQLVTLQSVLNDVYYPLISGEDNKVTEATKNEFLGSTSLILSYY